MGNQEKRFAVRYKSREGSDEYTGYVRGFNPESVRYSLSSLRPDLRIRRVYAASDSLHCAEGIPAAPEGFWRP